jgi:hypothetical protein
VKLLSSHGVLTLKDLSSPTTNYFMKLPGYDTLRLLLSARTILVEGPSDELIVQKAYREVHGKLPLDDGVDVIAVGSLAFKRFLEIGAMLKQRMCVVTDNDGDVAALREKYKDYLGGQHPTITICFDEDETCNTLEPQLLKANPRVKLNEVFGTTHRTDEALLAYMKNNKTDCALKVLTTTEALTLSVNMRETVTPRRFSVEGESGLECDERIGAGCGWAGDRGRSEGDPAAVHGGVQAEDRPGGRRL